MLICSCLMHKIINNSAKSNATCQQQIISLQLSLTMYAYAKSTTFYPLGNNKKEEVCKYNMHRKCIISEVEVSIYNEKIVVTDA